MSIHSYSLFHAWFVRQPKQVHSPSSLSKIPSPLDITPEQTEHLIDDPRCSLLYGLSTNLDVISGSGGDANRPQLLHHLPPLCSIVLVFLHHGHIVNSGFEAFRPYLISEIRPGNCSIDSILAQSYPRALRFRINGSNPLSALRIKKQVSGSISV